MPAPKKVLLCYDAHLSHSKKPNGAYLLFKRFCVDFKPDELVIGGDFLDCEPLSHWVMDKHRRVEGQRIILDYDLANKELDFFEKYCKKIVYLEGNHENWIEDFIDRNPALEGTLEIRKNLRLKERGIEWVSINKLYRVGKLYCTHGFYTSKYHSIKHLLAYGCNIVYGHVHQPQVSMINMKMVEPYKAVSLGCLCGHEPEYMENRPANWMNGFGIVYLHPNGEFNLYSVDIVNGKFISPMGKIYD